jgi:replicative DNA helicase
MGKTAFGLGIARNVSEWGSSLFLSMEMSRDQVNDRLIAALGKLPIAWLRRPNDKTPEDRERFNNMTHAFQRAQDLNLYIDDQTALNMLDIRAKSRSVKRKQGLDVLVIDQLSFITGGASDKSWEVVGEYTRGLLQLAKELNIAIVLLCQLNRKCEERNNKRPMLSDLAVSGSIEQDAANVIFLYRDEVYNPDSQDKGVCEVITAKQRQGEPGIVGLTYIGNQTRFEDLATPWQPSEQREKPRSRGFD